MATARRHRSTLFACRFELTLRMASSPAFARSRARSVTLHVPNLLDASATQGDRPCRRTQDPAPAYGVRCTFVVGHICPSSDGPRRQTLFQHRGDRGAHLKCRSNRFFPSRHPRRGAVFRFNPEDRTWNSSPRAMRNPQDVPSTITGIYSPATTLGLGRQGPLGLCGHPRGRQRMADGHHTSRVPSRAGHGTPRNFGIATSPNRGLYIVLPSPTSPIVGGLVHYLGHWPV